jgi:Zn-dependent protease
MNVILIVETFVTFVIAVTIHEAAHAGAAALLGDSTPVSEGRLSFAPGRQMAAVGTVVAIVFSVYSLGFPVGFGWGRPVNVDARRLRAGPNFGTFLVALAGPLTNLLLGLAAAVGLRMLPGYNSLSPVAELCDPGVSLIGLPLQTCLSHAQPGYLLRIEQLLFAFALTNIVLALLNLIPLHPLDGYKMLYALLPAEPAISLRRWEPYMEFGLLVLFFVVPIIFGFLSIPFNPAEFVVSGALRILGNIADNIARFFAWL